MILRNRRNVQKLKDLAGKQSKRIYINLSINEKINVKSHYSWGWRFDLPKENVFQIDLERLSKSSIKLDRIQCVMPLRYRVLNSNSIQHIP